MWRELIQALDPNCTLFPPATEQQIAVVEQNLGVALPNDLRSLLSETNGVIREYSYLINNLDDIMRNNSFFRTNSHYVEAYMPFDCLLFFAEVGTGDLFAFPIVGKTVRKDVFVWEHEDDSRVWVAPSMEKYLEWWIEGKIEL
jgi:hypothetical protein